MCPPSALAFGLRLNEEVVSSQFLSEFFKVIRMTQGHGLPNPPPDGLRVAILSFSVAWGDSEDESGGHLSRSETGPQNFPKCVWHSPTPPRGRRKTGRCFAPDP